MENSFVVLLFDFPIENSSLFTRSSREIFHSFSHGFSSFFKPKTQFSISKSCFFSISSSLETFAMFHNLKKREEKIFFFKFLVNFFLFSYKKVFSPIMRRMLGTRFSFSSFKGMRGMLKARIESTIGITTATKPSAKTAESSPSTQF